MIVAGSVNASKGLWAQAGGYELPLTYGGIAVVIGFTGAGEWSLDHALGLDDLSGAPWGTAALAAAAVASIGVIVRAARTRRSTGT
jgi:putative oxidoreductase